MSNEMFRKVMVAVMSAGCDPYDTHAAAATKFQKRWKDQVRREQEKQARRAARIEFGTNLK